LRIAIDATIIRGEITGTGFYIVNLLKGLSRIDNSNEYFIFGDRKNIEKYGFKERKNFKIEDRRFKNRIIRVLWEFFIFPFELKKLGICILHSPNYITPMIKLGYMIAVTVHDLTSIIFPGRHTLIKRILLGKMLPLFLKNADVVLADSENTRKDIIRLLSIRESKIFVTYVSFSDSYNDRIGYEESKKVVSEYGIKKDFILYVGMIEPRKNIILILKAFQELDSELDLDLVIVGRKGWYYREIEQYMENIKRAGLKNNIIFTGYVPEEDLRYFYRSAYIFVFPSLYEGFGLPPVQAMACGTPVITSNTSSLPEVVGDAAIKIDPENIKSFKEAVKVLCSDNKKRDELAARGIEQVKRFSIEKIASNVLFVYNSLNP
jgi:glycosyltransferase involved in cell wall biosynthesis